MGAEIVKEVADKTNTEAGDGTTTSVVLAESIIEEGLKRTTMGANAMNIREGVEDAAQDAISEIEDESKQVRGDDIEHIASVAAESEELGEIIAETIDTVGKDGVVTVEESQFMGLESEVVEGLEFDSGYVSPHMVTDQDRMEAEYDDPAILVTDQTISQVDDILPLLEKLANSGTKELVIIADDVEGQALATFIVNKLRGGFNVLAVEAPGFGDRKKDQLEDIATVVGAEVISEDVGMQLDSVELSHLGSADRVIATKDSTTIVGGDGTKKAIEKRVERLKRQLENEDSSFTRDNIEERIAKLTGGVAVIRVGAATESEMEYLKLKIEDAVNATKAAIEEGVLPGGGTALVRIAETLRDNADDLSGHPDYQTGYNILVRALDAPLKQIAENAGEEEGAAILHEIRAHKKKGYDAEAGEVVSDMMDAGIMDPAKVTKRAVENAAS
ncbi:MAG: chaperonin GroEL, partial [Parcubacteria group bacterium SW_4_46_8]